MRLPQLRPAELSAGTETATGVDSIPPPLFPSGLPNRGTGFQRKADTPSLRSDSICLRRGARVFDRRRLNRFNRAPTRREKSARDQRRYRRDSYMRSASAMRISPANRSVSITD